MQICFFKNLYRRLGEAEVRINLLKEENEKIMATLQDVLNDLAAIQAAITQRDTIDAQLRQQIKDLLAQAGASVATQADIDNAFTQAEAAKAALTAENALDTPETTS